MHMPEQTSPVRHSRWSPGVRPSNDDPDDGLDDGQVDAADGDAADDAFADESNGDVIDADSTGASE